MLIENVADLARRGKRWTERNGRAHPAAAATGALLVGAGLAWAWSRTRTYHHNAPGWPGAPPHWAPSDKDGIGTALGPGLGGSSLVWFTLGQGGLTEIFYPRAHKPCTRDLALVVTDGRDFCSDERSDAEHRVERVEEGTLTFRQVNLCKQGRYRIEKLTVANPSQDAVVQRVRFTPLRGALGDYRLYALLNPHMGEQRDIGTTGRVGRHKGRKMLFGQRGRTTMALACSAPWRACSAGYLGASKGRTDLHRHRRLARTYAFAREGNVLLTGEIDLPACGGDFVLALAFGPRPDEAGHRALASLLDDFDELWAAYAGAWRDWQSRLLPLEDAAPDGRNLYRTSTAVLRAHEGSAVPGAIVASLSIPWGQVRGDGDLGRGGYHVIWPRDQVEVAGGLLAAGAAGDALQALDYLRAAQEADGHWPQNMWAGGQQFSGSIQMGETALPILLVDLLRREGALPQARLERYWPMVERALGYILHHGPASQEDRWEDERGFTPFTLSALIAALVAAADLAARVGKPDISRFLEETADAWNDAIEYWTYVEDTALARAAEVRGYYLRIAPPDERGEPTKYDGHLRFWYEPSFRETLIPADIVSCDALAYVRFGLRAPDDPRIVDTLKVIDSLLKVDTPYGPCWHRHNFDGYGEKRDGSPFDGVHGIGRAWPLLTGERAHYELAAGHRDEAVRLVRAMERFAGPGGMIPEQVWDTDEIPERDLRLGRPSGSAMPLAWAHAEYVKLLRSLRDGRVFDTPPRTYQRYVADKVVSPRVIWRPSHRRRSVPAGKRLRITLRVPAVVRWQAEDGLGGELATRDSGLGAHYADLPMEHVRPGGAIRFELMPTSGVRLPASEELPEGPQTVAVE